MTSNITTTYNPTDQITEITELTYNDSLKFEAFAERLRLGEKILLILIAVFTILGNTLVLIATWRERSLHQPNKYFIACLAFADLLAGLFIAPLKVYLCDNESFSRSMPIHPGLYRFKVWIDTFALGTSIYTLTFISVDRYLKISKPLLYKSRMTTSRSLKIIFVIAFISISLATYPASPRLVSRGTLAVGYGVCKQIRNGETIIFYLSLSIIGILLPTTIIVIMYALIFRVAHKRNKMIINGELGETFNDQNQRPALRKDMKVIKMLLVVVGTFLFCWSPLFIWLWLIIFHPKAVPYRTYHARIITSIVLTLPLVNSLCNPIIYACLDQTYREAFKHLFRRMICRADLRRQQPPIELRPPRTR